MLSRKRTRKDRPCEKRVMKKMNFKKACPSARQGFTHKNFLKKISDGFTLIELLVVMAIIGILAAVVLASLNDARGKGGDAAIKSNLENMRLQAELIYAGSGCYGDGDPVDDSNCVVYIENDCFETSVSNTLFGNTTIAAQIQAAINAGGIGTGGFNDFGVTGWCATSGTPGKASVWAVSVTLKSNPTRAWCVDSTGTSMQVVPGDNGISINKCGYVFIGE